MKKFFLLPLAVIIFFSSCMNEDESGKINISFSNWNDDVSYAEVMIFGSGGYSESVDVYEEQLALILKKGNYTIYVTFYDSREKIIATKEASFFIGDEEENLRITCDYLSGSGNLVIKFDIDDVPIYDGAFVILSIGKNDGTYLLRDIKITKSDEGYSYTLENISSGEYTIDARLYDSSGSFLSEKSTRSNIYDDRDTSLFFSFTEFGSENPVILITDSTSAPIEGTIEICEKNPQELTLKIRLEKIPINVKEDEIDIYWYQSGKLIGTGKTVSTSSGGRIDVTMESVEKGSYGSETFYVQI